MTTLTDEQLAEAGYDQVLTAISERRAHENFDLWRPKALQRFREAFVGNTINPGWLEQLVADLKAKHFVCVITIGDELHLANAPELEEDAIALILNRQGNGEKTILVLHPQVGIVNMTPPAASEY